MPRAVAITSTAASVAVPVSTMAASERASSMAQVWVIIIRRRRSSRSAMAPPTKVKARMGRPRQRLSSARSKGDPVIWMTSQLSAI